MTIMTNNELSNRRGLIYLTNQFKLVMIIDIGDKETVSKY